MALSMKKQLIFAQLESDANHTITAMAVTDGILCSAPQLSPLEGSSVSRDFIRQYYGNSGEIRVENFMKVDFETELAPNAVGTASPLWDKLLLACNFYKTAATGTDLVGGATTTGSTTTSIILSATGSPNATTIDYYKGAVIFIGGEARVITAYNQTTKTVTITDPLSNAPASGLPVAINFADTYAPTSSINWGQTAATSQALTIYFQIDGVRHAMQGARGTYSVDMSAKKIPKIKWSFTGLLVDPAAITDINGTFAGWGVPVATSTQNTRNVSLLSTAISTGIETLTFDIANDVKHRQLIGSESVLITDRKPKAAISFETGTAASVATWFANAKAGLSGGFSFYHGNTPGGCFGFNFPNVQVMNPKYSDSDGVAMISLDLNVMPTLSGTGNDEFILSIF